MFRNSKNRFGRGVAASTCTRGAGRYGDCVCETLERRTLLSAGAILDANGILTITGTDQSDDIWIYRDRDNPDYLNAYAKGPDGVFQPVRIADVRGIAVYGLGGDDFIGVWNDPYHEVDLFTVDTLTEFGKLNIPVTMYGGDGNDELYSESNADDLLVGGRGMDHAYVLDGHDRFAVETVENYRGCKWITDPDTGERHFIAGGGFLWKGPEDEIYPDPYEVPTRRGTYGGANIPTFPEDTDNGHGQDQNAPSPPPVLVDVKSVDSESGGDAVAPTAPVTMTALVPPPLPASPFSTRPFAYGEDAGHKPWDDVVVA